VSASRIDRLRSGRLTPGKKAQLVQRVARELGEAFPGIDTLPDVCFV
jgi:hypothetical protein